MSAKSAKSAVSRITATSLRHLQNLWVYHRKSTHKTAIDSTIDSAKKLLTNEKPMSILHRYANE